MDQEPGLGGVCEVVAVASGKGGVGKSISTVLLGRALRDLGYKVGLMDADILGPSLPLLLDLEESPLEVISQRAVKPHHHHGLKVVSPGMIQQSGEASLLRGPIASRMVSQWLQSVVWGELDYLLLDYPPGTGDIPLTLAGELNLTALIITTPHILSYQEAEKSLQMFHSLAIGVLGWLETMSYFEARKGERYDLFGGGKEGKGGKEGGISWHHVYGLSSLGRIPLDLKLSQRVGTGSLLDPDWSCDVCEAYLKAARPLVTELKQLRLLEENGVMNSFSLKWSGE